MEFFYIFKMKWFIHFLYVLSLVHKISSTSSSPGLATSEFEQALPFIWDKNAHSKLLEAYKSKGAVMEDAYPGISLCAAGVCSETNSCDAHPYASFDGCVPQPPASFQQSQSLSTTLLAAVIDSMSQTLQPHWRVFSAIQYSEGEEDRSVKWIWPTYSSEDSAETVRKSQWIQLARRNFNLVEPDPTLLLSGEQGLDPISALLAVYQLAHASLLTKSLHVFCPGLLYSPLALGNGTFDDVSRVDVTPPSFSSNGTLIQPGVISLDWNWKNANRARPNYSVGTALFI